MDCKTLFVCTCADAIWSEILGELDVDVPPEPPDTAETVVLFVLEELLFP